MVVADGLLENHPRQSEKRRRADERKDGNQQSERGGLLAERNILRDQIPASVRAGIVVSGGVRTRTGTSGESNTGVQLCYLAGSGVGSTTVIVKVLDSTVPPPSSLGTARRT